MLPLDLMPGLGSILIVFFFLMEVTLLMIQVTPYGGNPVERGVHLHEVWPKLHFEVAPQVRRGAC